MIWQILDSLSWSQATLLVICFAVVGMMLFDALFGEEDR